jgi:hypothetical protein
MKLNKAQREVLLSERKRYQSMVKVNPKNPFDLLGAKIMLEVINLMVIINNAGSD